MPSGSAGDPVVQHADKRRQIRKQGKENDMHFHLLFVRFLNIGMGGERGREYWQVCGASEKDEQNDDIEQKVPVMLSKTTAPVV
jgi:hypothetical protein